MKGFYTELTRFLLAFAGITLLWAMFNECPECAGGIHRAGEWIEAIAVGLAGAGFFTLLRVVNRIKIIQDSVEPD